MDKTKVHQACLKALEAKIDIAKKGMEEAQASANNETKSSAGDKYETGRAMSQRERDLHARQLAELMNIKKTLSSIDPSRKCPKVELGALVETESTIFYIAGSLGALKVEETQVMVISAISPIAQLILDQKKGFAFEWMKKSNSLLAIH